MESNLDELLALKDMRISEMNSSELQTVWKVLKAMEYSISTAGKTLASSKYERTAQWADALKEDTKTRKARVGKLAEVQLDVETPYTFFGQYGEAGKEIYRMLRNAQDSQTVMTNEVAAQVQEIVDQAVY